jgi:hypothetical protein
VNRSAELIPFRPNSVIRTLAVREQGIIYQDSGLSFVVEGDSENKVITIPVSGELSLSFGGSLPTHLSVLQLIR